VNIQSADQNNSWRKLLRVGMFLFLLTISILAGCRDDRPIVDFSSNSDTSSPALKPSQQEPLRIAIGAMISPEITREYFQKLLEMIGERVGRRVVFSQRRTYAETNALIKAHDVDVALVCAGPYTEGRDDFGMEMLVVPESHGQTVYHSYILARKDSSIESFDDLRGKRFAFTDPNSNTGCLVPTYMLAKRGETPEFYFSETFFSGSHDNSIKAVANGLADGTAVDSLIWEFMNIVDPKETSRTKIIEKSPAYGIPPIVVHPDLDEKLKQKLKAAFLSIHEDPEAIPFLHKIQIDRFVEGNDSQYDSVREMRQWIEKFNKREKL